MSALARPSCLAAASGQLRHRAAPPASRPWGRRSIVLATSGALYGAERHDSHFHEHTRRKGECNCPRWADLWATIREEAKKDADAEPALASFLNSSILAHSSLERCVAFLLANKLGNATLLSTQLRDLFMQAYESDPQILAALQADIQAVFDRDPACDTYTQVLVCFKGFQALQCYRIGHWLWQNGRRPLALALQSRVSEAFHVDIHPAAVIGRGVMLDHATGVVIGETARVGDSVSMLHHVTLGGTGARGGDRHPKIAPGVLLGASVVVLGNVVLADGAKLHAGLIMRVSAAPASLCGLESLTISSKVGVPAKVLRPPPALATEAAPALVMDHVLFLAEWSDYEI